MMPRSLTLALLAYVVLEFSNPLMPGAVNFNADESVEGIQRHENGGVRRAPDATQPQHPGHLALAGEFRASVRPAYRPIAIRLSQASGLRVIDPRSADPPQSSEDH
jgi:hypothetical protein